MLKMSSNNQCIVAQNSLLQGVVVSTQFPLWWIHDICKNTFVNCILWHVLQLLQELLCSG